MTIPDAIYPWQQTQWDHLLKRRQANNLPHALLLAGIPGLGKQHFALRLVKLLLCQQEKIASAACGVCHACQLFAADTHPDFYRLQPEAAGKAIRIDQVRALTAQLQQTVQQGRYKIAVIAPAEALHIAAANALLKTLEEPTPQTLILLLSNQAGLLPATIRSRCQAIYFSPPSSADAKVWLSPHLPANANSNLLLALAEGAPLRALDYASGAQLTQYELLWSDLKNISQNTSDPIASAASWLKKPLADVIHCLLHVVMDIIRLKLGLPVTALTNQYEADFLRRLLPAIKLLPLFSYLDQLYQLRQNTMTHLNQQLLLEELFSAWHDHTHLNR
jgi:DNA polymerase-3 subunit delta'